MFHLQRAQDLANVTSYREWVLFGYLVCPDELLRVTSIDIALVNLTLYMISNYSCQFFIEFELNNLKWNRRHAYFGICLRSFLFVCRCFLLYLSCIMCLAFSLFLFLCRGFQVVLKENLVLTLFRDEVIFAACFLSFNYFHHFQ